MRRVVGALLALTIVQACASTSRNAGKPPTPVPSPIPDRTPVVTSAATPTVTPETPPAVPTPVAAATSHTDPPLVRILLERSSGAIVLDQPGRAYRARWAERETWLFGPIRMSAGAGDRSWQVAAFRDDDVAREVSRRLREHLGPGVETTLTRTDNGYVRLRVRWLDREPADAKAVLAAAGHPEAFAVPGGGRLHVESSATGPLDIPGELVLEPNGDWPVSVAGTRYLGRLRVRTVGGEVLVINELNLESYLKGVVPAEMGPSQFPQLDALKAQTVAARTYAVAHLGDHDDEGYDLCDTPACQVYGGADVQHPLTDRAVDETAGLIAVFDGQPIDAMYTSTCGGHTESSWLLFEGRAQPYLAGVPCLWERPLLISGEAGGTTFKDVEGFRVHLAKTALELSADAEPQQVADRVAVLCDGRKSRLGDHPSPAEFTDALLAAGGLEQMGALVGQASAGGLAELADLFDVPLEVPSGDENLAGWYLRAALAILQIQGVVGRDAGEAVPHPDGVGIFPRNAQHSEPLPSPVPLFWRWDSTYGNAQTIRVFPGTTLERFRTGDRLLAVVVVQSGGGGEADRRSAWRSWARDRSWEELARRLEIPDLTRLEVTRRGPSGRVVGLVAEGRSGIRKDLKGFPIRRALDLPENLFSFHIMTGADGARIVRFLGRGWGHGVGLCQNGAYGLARSGMTFDRILQHYYTGIEISAWRQPAH